MCLFILLSQLDFLEYLEILFFIKCCKVAVTDTLDGGTPRLPVDQGQFAKRLSWGQFGYLDEPLDLLETPELIKVLNVLLGQVHVHSRIKYEHRVCFTKFGLFGPKSVSFSNRKFLAIWLRRLTIFFGKFQ